MNSFFFELLHMALGHRDSFSVAPTMEQWRVLYDMAVRQTLVGVLFPAIERLPAEQRPPRVLLLQWFATKEQIMKNNKLLNRRAVETIEFFHNEGFDCCILKGQGIASLYPNPLLRTSGDIDIWLGRGRKRIYDFARRTVGMKGVTYHHIHYPLHKDAEVEVHVTPGHLFAPIENAKLQRYFKETAKEQFQNTINLPDEKGEICVPTREFNLIYILLHIYGHLFGEGIGLRQVMDYYFILRQPLTEDIRERTLHRLKELKMLRFARAMMWVQKEVFGLENEYLLIEPDEKEGRFLLSEIMQAGNFGKYDARIDRKNHHKLLPRVWNSIRRKWKFLTHYPNELVWDIPFRMWQYCWSRWVKG